MASISFTNPLALLAIFVLLANSVTAAAPDSLAGYLGRRQKDEVPTRSVTESSLVFHADGTYQENWARLKSTHAVPLASPVADFLAPEAGAYLYRKISDSIAELTLLPATGVARGKLTLNFTSDLVAVAAPPPFSGGIGDQFNFVAPAGQPGALANISTRARVHAGEPLIVGFVAARSADFVIRVAGPALAQFQVADVWNRPHFKLYAGADEVRAWSSIIQDGISVYPLSPRWDLEENFRRTNAQAAQRVGAFPFAPGSNDVAIVVSLQRGPHTIVIQPAASDQGGNALVEVYELGSL